MESGKPNAMSKMVRIQSVGTRWITHVVLSLRSIEAWVLCGKLEKGEKKSEGKGVLDKGKKEEREKGRDQPSSYHSGS